MNPNLCHAQGPIMLTTTDFFFFKENKDWLSFINIHNTYVKKRVKNGTFYLSKMTHNQILMHFI